MSHRAVRHSGCKPFINGRMVDASEPAVEHMQRPRVLSRRAMLTNCRIAARTVMPIGWHLRGLTTYMLGLICDDSVSNAFFAAKTASLAVAAACGH